MSLDGDDHGSSGGLTGAVRRGATSGAINVVSTRALAFISNIVIARILLPDDFGAVAVALVVQTVVLGVFEFGSTISIARREGDARVVAPTVMTITITSGLAFTVAVFALAPALASVLGNPAASPVIRVMSLTVFFAGLSAVPAAILWRDFHQGRRAIVDVTSSVVALGLVVPMALAGWGAMAPAWSRVVAAFVSACGYWLVSPIRFLPKFDRSEAVRILRLGVPVAMANLVVLATLNVDYIVIGRTLGPAELGIYLLAFNLASIPSLMVTEGVRTVALPLFAQLSRRGRLQNVALAIADCLGFVAFGIAAMVAGAGLPLVETLYGSGWIAAAAAMPGLALLGAARTISSLFQDVVVAAGRVVGQFWIQVLWLVVLIPAMVLGVRLGGIAGASAAHASVAWFVVMPVFAFILSSALGVPTRKTIVSWLPWFGSAVLSGVVAYGISTTVSPPIVAALASLVSAFLIYASVSARRALRAFRAVQIALK